MLLSLVSIVFIVVGLTVTADGNQFLVLGKNWRIRCEVRAEPSPEIEWTFNGEFLDPTSKSISVTSWFIGLLVQSMTNSRLVK